MPISKGLYNQTLTLQSVTETADSQGGVTSVWADVGNFRGRISPLSSAERLAQNKVGQFTSHWVYCDPMIVTTANRIKYDYSTTGTAYFEILGITNPSEAYHHLEINARELT